MGGFVKPGRFSRSQPSNGRCAASDRGITLIELLVVMVIISLFATLVGQRLFRNVERARQTTARVQISEFETVLDLFRLDVSRYPTDSEGLDALQVNPGGLENWDGPYMRRDVPLDPWNRPSYLSFSRHLRRFRYPFAGGRWRRRR